MSLPVLLYHNVGIPTPGRYPEQTIATEQFERHLQWLANHGYVGARLADWIGWTREGRRAPDKSVLITFDDGYASLAEYAFPFLVRYGFGAAVFVVTARLGATNTWDEACGYESHRLLTREQVVHWAASGIDFGTHGRTHADLTTLTVAECEREVAGSKDELGNLLGYEPRAFAYPYGGFNSQVVANVRDSFVVAFSLRRGVNTTRTNIHLLRRSVVTPHDSLRDFGYRLRFGVTPSAIVRRLRAGFRRLQSRK
jgi:peptidoglycan/xylan/chitin deacetylase (PgdA/CDA1 family)